MIPCRWSGFDLSPAVPPALYLVQLWRERERKGGRERRLKREGEREREVARTRERGRERGRERERGSEGAFCEPYESTIPLMSLVLMVSPFLSRFINSSTAFVT